MLRTFAITTVITVTLLFVFNDASKAQTPPPGQAQCAPRSSVVASLSEKYGETRRAIGLAANSMVLEMWASATGSWTVTVTTPQGVTCLVASGEGFEEVTEELPAVGEPA